MYKVLSVLFFLITYGKTWAQILPKEDGKLNYRIIGFSFPVPKGSLLTKQGVARYKIEIASGKYDNEDLFKKNIISSFSSNKNKIVGEVPAFGKQYTWRYICTNPVEIKSSLYHFSTAIISEVDTNVTRLRVMKHTDKYKGAYVFLDATRTLYDMNGMPVWFLPESNEMPVSNEMNYGDLKVTKKGTITIGRMSKYDEQFYEINYNGDILWKTPATFKLNKDSLDNIHQRFGRFSNGHYMSNCYTFDNCHRELTRLSNGHYMLLESEFMWLKLPALTDSSLLNEHYKYKNVAQDSNGVLYQRINFGKLIEYDSKSNVVWSWSTSGYFLGSDVYNHTISPGIFDVEDAHENAFYFDEKAKIIYVSFRNISRIIKIQYPSGKVLKVYGQLYDPDVFPYVNDFFYHQHNCSVTKEGYLSVYNNNDRGNGDLPTLLLMHEPVSKKDTLKKVWEYKCTIEGRDTTENEPSFGARGSFIELPDRSMIACMTSHEYTKVFILNRDKKIFWSAFPERLDPKQHKWKAIFEYRATMIMNRKELEQLIWNQ